MHDQPTLEQRRQRAILELNDFLRQECGGADIDAARVPDHHFVAGWRLKLQVLQKPREMNVYVEALFPFTAPRFQLVGGPPFLTWPHIEKDGMLCLGDEAFTVDPSRPVAMARQLLVEMAFPLLRQAENGSNRDDFRTEFYSYWNATVRAGDLRSSPTRPTRPSRLVRIWRGEHFAVVGETEDSVLRWLRNLYGDQKQFDSTESSCLLWLKEVPLPHEYPERSSDVSDMARSSERGQFLSELAVRERRSVPVIFGSISENGPCFGAVMVSNSERTNVMGRRINSMEAGFRPGRAPEKLVARRLFNSAAPVTRAKVERADAVWIHGRDQDPRQNTLASRRVVIVGCGAIGAPVASQLAMAGVGDLLLIDPESLAWANVGRHPLGAASVGFGKASELAKKLTVTFPHGHFDSRTEEWAPVGKGTKSRSRL